MVFIRSHWKMWRSLKTINRVPSEIENNYSASKHIYIYIYIIHIVAINSSKYAWPRVLAHVDCRKRLSKTSIHEGRYVHTVFNPFLPTCVYRIKLPENNYVQNHLDATLVRDRMPQVCEVTPRALDSACSLLVYVHRLPCDWIPFDCITDDDYFYLVQPVIIGSRIIAFNVNTIR